MDLPLAFGPPPLAGKTRVEPEDFFVEELLGFEPDGTGGHVLVTVEKRGANTGWVAVELARAVGVPARDVGYSGLKDRHAVTRQAFTLPWPAAAPLAPFESISGEGFRALGVARHGRKLRPGSHQANRFVIRIRAPAGNLDAIDARLAEIGRRGVPNYFGPQRYGRGLGNLARARAWASGGPAPRDRLQRGFALSAARSEIFNRIVAERVTRGDWDRLLPGEAVVLDGRRSYFRADEIDEALAQRSDGLDVHPSGALWGRGESPAGGAARAVEDAIVATNPELTALLESQGLRHERRSLRLPVRSLAWNREDDALVLSFVLPRGTFATAVLHEVLHGAWDSSEGGDE